MGSIDAIKNTKSWHNEQFKDDQDKEWSTQRKMISNERECPNKLEKGENPKWTQKERKVWLEDKQLQN